MNARRFRPTLDSLPSRITPSSFSTTIAETAPPTESLSTEITLQEIYPTITVCQELEDPDESLLYT